MNTGLRAEIARIHAIDNHTHDDPVTGKRGSGWHWLLTEKSRDAVAIALTAMMNDGEITSARAIEIARMVFRENAAQLGGLQGDSRR